MNMVERAQSFAKNLLHKVEPWLSGPAPFHTSQRICLTFSGNNLSLLQINKEKTSVEILLNENIEFNNNNDLTTTLAGITKRYQLERIPACWLLTPEDYQLFFIDALPVKGNEFKDALDWRLRSLINFPIQEAATDYFMLPAKKSAANQPMVVAVAARKQVLLKSIAIFNNAGITMNTIDVPELALRNLSATCENDEKSTAFLYFYSNMAILNLSRQKILYFTRRLIIPPSDQPLPNFYENMSLEILRYFDFFQSQWRFPSPSRLYIASYNGKTDDIIAGLNKNLMTKLEPFPLSQIIVDQSKASRLENTSLLALGAALPQEEANVTTEH